MHQRKTGGAHVVKKSERQRPSRYDHLIVRYGLLAATIVMVAVWLTMRLGKKN